MKKKILVIFTGGTISSTSSGGERDVEGSVARVLLENFKKNNGSIVEFETAEPFIILSENITPLHWQKLYDLIKTRNFDDYAGIIITHGSDTLTYTAAGIGFLFHSIKIPIVFVAANHPLTHPKSNGYANFFNAVHFISGHEGGGVFVVYQDHLNKNRVYLATRLQEIDRYNDRFIGFGDVEYGEIKDKIFHPFHSPLNQNKGEDYKDSFDSNIKFEKHIMYVKSFPGLDYSCFNLQPNIAAVLCVLYHSSTWCNPDGKVFAPQYYLPSFFDKCKEQNIDMYLCSFKDGAELYHSCGELISRGAKPLRNISFESAYMKLNIAYNKKGIDPKEYMKNQIYFEYLPNSKLSTI